MSIDDWSLPDANAGKELETIDPLPARARSLLVRNRTKPMLKGYGVVAVLGAIEMLEGLDYHHYNVIKITSTLASGDSPLASAVNIDHEVVAYINRAGQFYFFARSTFAKSVICDFPTCIPTIARLMVFRNKHTAHRSMDYPQGESEDEKVAHARAVSSMMGFICTPKPDAPKLPTDSLELAQLVRKVGVEQFQRDQWKHSYRTFQTFDSKLGSSGSSVNFTMEVEHPKIMREAYCVVERIILNE